MKTGYQEIVRTLCPFTKENLNISKEKSTKIKKKTKKKKVKNLYSLRLKRKNTKYTLGESEGVR